MAKKKSRKRRYPVVNCQFCNSGIVPDYKGVKELEEFLTERGKILSRSKTGVCSKHQRRLAREIKRARYLALLPFVVKV